MSPELLIASHLRLAKEAINATRLLLRDGNRNAVYQAEQAVEQIVLALAQAEGTHFPRAQHHQLDTMVRQLPPENFARSELLTLTWLEAYATTFRYPRTAGGLTDAPPSEKLEDAVAKVESLLKDLAGHFGVDLDIAVKSPAVRARPPRAG